MPFTDYFSNGEWNAQCDICGFTYKSGDLRKRWDGLMVCPNDYETRHPQELMWRIPKEVTPTWTRPQSDIDITNFNTAYTGCAIDNQGAIAGDAIAGCAVSGNIRGLF